MIRSTSVRRDDATTPCRADLARQRDFPRRAGSIANVEPSFWYSVGDMMGELLDPRYLRGIECFNRRTTLTPTKNGSRCGKTDRSGPDVLPRADSGGCLPAPFR